MTTTRPRASSANLFRPDLSARIQKRKAEAQTVVSSVKEAEQEEKKKSSFLCLSTYAFRFLDDIFTRNEKL